MFFWITDIRRFLGSGRIQTNNCSHSPHAAVHEPDLDTVRVERGICQDLLHDAPCQFSAPLISLEDNIDSTALVYGIPVLSTGCRFRVFVHGYVQCMFWDVISACTENVSIFKGR